MNSIRPVFFLVLPGNLGVSLQAKNISFHVIDEEGWEWRLNELFMHK